MEKKWPFGVEHAVDAEEWFFKEISHFFVHSSVPTKTVLEIVNWFNSIIIWNYRTWEVRAITWFPESLLIIWLCNIFELVFTLCHKCNKYNYPPWKMLNHAWNSDITRRKQLCHPLDTVMSHRKQLYRTLVHVFCILIRSGSNPTSPLLSKVNRGAEF